MTYFLRTNDGQLIAKLENSLANEVMINVKGEFKTVNFTSGRKTVYELSEDKTVKNGAITLMLFTGFRVVSSD